MDLRFKILILEENKLPKIQEPWRLVKDIMAKAGTKIWSRQFLLLIDPIN